MSAKATRGHRCLPEKYSPKGIAWLWDSVYGAGIASIGNVSADEHIRMYASEKGKSVVRRGRKTYGPPIYVR